VRVSRDPVCEMIDHMTVAEIDGLPEESKETIRKWGLGNGAGSETFVLKEVGEVFNQQGETAAIQVVEKQRGIFKIIAYNFLNKLRTEREAKHHRRAG